jgi:putative membrane protein
MSRIREKKLNRIAWVITSVIFITVILMRRVKIQTTIDFGFLPLVHSTLNILTAIILIMAFYFIRVTKNMRLHRNSIYVALSLSCLFLVSYVLYHFTSEEIAFCKDGIIRTVYFIILVSHIILAAIVLPLVLFTFNRAYTGQYIRHKKMARWVFPIWLYVAISGPVCFLMLWPCYKGSF